VRIAYRTMTKDPNEGDWLPSVTCLICGCGDGYTDSHLCPTCEFEVDDAQGRAMRTGMPVPTPPWGNGRCVVVHPDRHWEYASPVTM
jgi:hypothetical protein